MFKKEIPEYIYQSCTNVNLQQGDIIRVKGELANLFNQFYPCLNHDEATRQDQFVMVLSQTCDLVRAQGRSVKVEHLNMCLVRTFDSLVKRDIAKQRERKGNITTDFLREFSKKLIRLMNNSESKCHFFLPKTVGLPSDMVAILNLNYPFRVDHYELFLQNRVASLEGEFRAKIGMILSHLYGRVATKDLSEYGWTEEDSVKYVQNILEKCL